MPDDVPIKPVGRDERTRFDRAVWEAIWGAGQLIPGVGVFISKTTKGRVIRVKLQPEQVGAGAPAAVSTFHFKTMFANYYMTEEGVRVAKQYKMRNSVVNEITPDGTLWTMSYKATGPTAFIERLKTGPFIEYQGISPVYQADITTGGIHVPADEIIAVEPDGGTSVVTEAADILDPAVPPGTPVTYVELSPGRMWRKKIDQTAISIP